MWTRLSRLFVIKTRFEAFLVTYAIAIGAIERGQHYMQTYPGTMGALLALACTGVVFLAGAKLLDSVRVEPAVAAPRPRPARRRRTLSRTRPKSLRPGSGAGSRRSLHRD